jgi:hypothetical protein
MLIATVFWERKGEVMMEFMQQRATITSELYHEVLTNA